MDETSDKVSPLAASREGNLFYIVGASAGKNRLLAYARAQLSEHHTLIFAHRYVAGARDNTKEYEVSLTDAEFELRERHGLFAMSWESRGLRYGVGHEINYWLAKGLSVVIKGSRAYLGQALIAYPDVTVISVVTETDIDGWRPARRARESGPDINGCAEHLRSPRHAPLRIIQVKGDGVLSVAGEKLVAVLAGETVSPA